MRPSGLVEAEPLRITVRPPAAAVLNSATGASFWLRRKMLETTRSSDGAWAGFGSMNSSAPMLVMRVWSAALAGQPAGAPSAQP